MKDELELFVEKYCVGKEYDSCHNSPCRYASVHGCQHPEHPWNKEKKVEDVSEDRELEPYRYDSMKAPIYNGL